jgi:hypothetical protein
MQTLGDIQDRFRLYAVCSDCNRMELVEMALLVAQLGVATTVDTVRRRLRCRGCGVRTGDIRIVYVGSQTRSAAFHYRGHSNSRGNSDGNSRGHSRGHSRDGGR